MAHKYRRSHKGSDRAVFSKAASDYAVKLLHDQQDRHVERVNYVQIAARMEEYDGSWKFDNGQVRDHLKSLDPKVTRMVKKNKMPSAEKNEKGNENRAF
jgi:hypothetical protein